APGDLGCAPSLLAPRRGARGAGAPSRLSGAALAGGLPPRPRPRALVPPDERGVRDAQADVARGLRVCPALADRDELPLRQERARPGERSPLVLGEPPEAPADRHPRLRIPPLAAAARAPGASGAAPAKILPPN